MKENIKSAIAKIKALKVELQQDLAEVPSMIIRTDNVLDTLSNGLLHFIGESIDAPTEAFKPSPITHVLGEEVIRSEKVTEEDINPTKADKESLKQQADAAYETFLERDNKVLMESLDDIVIRAVAKKAGMKDVTSTVPEKLTLEFIDEVKAAIVSKAEIEASKKASTPNKRK